MTEKIINYKGSPVFYRIAGKGRIVLLIHGFPADGELWNNQADLLKDHYKLIIPDVPGSGRSALIPNANIETYAAVIRLILDNEMQSYPAESADEVIIIGHSMGGYITLAFAEMYPEYLASFGLFHSTAFADTEEKKQARTKAIAFIGKEGHIAFLKSTVPGMFTTAFREEHPGEIIKMIKKGEASGPEALIQYYQAMKDRPDRITILKKFSKPVLFIIGEQDTAIALQSSLQQCHLPAQSQVHILDKTAHMGMWEEKDKANQLLLNFLNYNKF